MRRDQLAGELRKACPQLKSNLDALSERWLSAVQQKLDDGAYRGLFPKLFNDPVWGTIEVLPWEIILMDSLLLQRLRGVRQLGFAHHVFPGAIHDRLEHTRGVLEAADRMLARLERNAEHRKQYGAVPDTAIPETTREDYYTVRLAALLHDIGHGPFSHAIEPIIEQRYGVELKAAADTLRKAFEGVGSISASEIIACLVILSGAFDHLLNHPDFNFPTSKQDLAVRLIARILGSRSQLQASYLSGIVSGPIDADKLDYMARDSHHAGLNVGLDTDRLISKLEVILITPDNLPPRLSDLRDRAANAQGQRVYDMGISLSGIGAYEQLISSRVVLYDRVYYHHKVRAAEAMAQRLVQVAEEERGRSFSIEELFLDVSDDTMIEVLGGRLSCDEVEGGKTRARELASRISQRRLYHRALAFASRFIEGMEGFQEEETRDSERAAIWSRVTKGLDNMEKVQELEREIYTLACEIAEQVDGELSESGTTLRPEQIIVDLPFNKTAPTGNHLLTRTHDDQIGLPNLFFDPERWSNAYEQQKRCGYVFCPREHIPLVSFAARIVLFRRFRFGVNESADRFTKTSGVVKSGWIDTLAKQGVIDAECQDSLKRERVFLSRVEAADIKLPAEWVGDSPDLPRSLAREISIVRSGGFMQQIKADTLATLEALAGFVKMTIEGGEYSRAVTLSEAQLQADLRKHLRATMRVLEGAEYGGGETDLIARDRILIENKVEGETDTPMSDRRPYPFQARRYSLALCTSVFFTMVAYKPRTEQGHLRQCDCVKVFDIREVSEPCAEIRLLVPYGYSAPSEAKRPKTAVTRTSRNQGKRQP